MKEGCLVIFMHTTFLSYYINVLNSVYSSEGIIVNADKTLSYLRIKLDIF
jgi:hypothetical protein